MVKTIRYILTGLLVYGVWVEAGKWTALSVLLLGAGIEFLTFQVGILFRLEDKKL